MKSFHLIQHGQFWNMGKPVVMRIAHMSNESVKRKNNGPEDQRAVGQVRRRITIRPTPSGWLQMTWRQIPTNRKQLLTQLRQQCHVHSTIDSRYIAVECCTLLHTAKFRKFGHTSNLRKTHISSSRATYGYISWVVWRKLTVRYRKCTVFWLHNHYEVRHLL